MKHTLLSLLSVLLIAWPLQAVTVTGRVVDRDGNPVVNVTVATDIAGKGTIGTAEGTFTLEHSGEINWITFSCVGFHPKQFLVGEIPQLIVLETAYYHGTDITVSAERATPGLTPIAFDNISADQIERDYMVGEFPLLLQGTPNLQAYSDAGSAFGYTYLRIRGFDDKRIMTYINGVPLNDPEDQATYFADLPDFASTATDIQIQRGVGNSLYGDGGFGGTISIVTSPLSQPRKTTLTAGYGDYTANGNQVAGIYRQSIEYNSGLISGRWHYGGRFSRQASGGYREGSWYEGWSYYYSVARIDPKMTTEFEAYGGPMRMHLSYFGATRSALASNRLFNPLSYANETDNFNQPHYQLTNRYRLSDHTTLTNTLYYIRGKGYYEQLKSATDYYDYNLVATPGVDSGAVVRQQWVHKNQIGWNPRVDIRHDWGRRSFGGSYYHFESNHWGQVTWAENLPFGSDPSVRFYQYFGEKQAASLFAEEFRQLSDRLHLKITLQGRYQRYQFDQVWMGAFEGHQYEVDWFFFSPRAGLTYVLNDQMMIYGNFSIASRTPTDASIYQANDPNILPSLDIISIDSISRPGQKIYDFGDPTARAERVYDYELGLDYRQTNYSFGLSLFWMDFHDEIIPYGGINDDGIAFTVNADRSVHSGIELTGVWQPDQLISFSGNFSYNYNRIKSHAIDLDIFDSDWAPAGSERIDLSGKHIPGFPEYLGNLTVRFSPDNFHLAASTQLLGKQYVESLNSDSLAIEPAAVVSFSFSYLAQNLLGLGDMTFSFRVENIFDQKYETAGYGWSYFQRPGGPQTQVRIDEAEYYPAAEKSYYVQAKLELF